MGSSAKKKSEKKKDFQKAKLKVGKTRPKNTNATDTSFTAKSIVIKQQSLSEQGRDASGLFNHNLSLLSSRSETQRRDSLAFLTSHVASEQDLPQSISTIFEKALPLLLDGNSTVRVQVLKLAKNLPAAQLGSLDSALLYVRAGLTHLSVDIRLHTLDFLDWLLDVKAEEVVCASGGWIKLLRTFMNLLNWSAANLTNGKWSSTKSSSNVSGSSKLLVHQLTTLAALLRAGLSTQHAIGIGAPSDFPLWHHSAHSLPTRSNPYGYLNLFGATADVENEVHESAQERRDVLVESGIKDAIVIGVEDVRKQGGETGRAASTIVKALKLGSNG